MKQIQIGLIVKVSQISTPMKISRENVSVFINSPVLDDCLFAFANYLYLLKSTVQKVNLKVKCPPGHVTIKITEIRILIHRFVQRRPIVVFSQFFNQCGFAATNVASYS